MQCMHRAIFCYIFCPSVCLMHVLCLKKWINLTVFNDLVELSLLSFWAPPPLQNPNTKSFSGGVKYMYTTRGRKIAIFDGNHRLPRKWYEKGSWLLWSSNRKPIDPYRFQWPWVTLKGGSRGVKFVWQISIITLVWFDLRSKLAW